MAAQGGRLRRLWRWRWVGEDGRYGCLKKEEGGRGGGVWVGGLCAEILITVSTNSASSKPGQCILLDENMHQPA